MATNFLINTPIGENGNQSGRPAYYYYQQISQTLIAEGGSKIASFFAEPVSDDLENIIDWYSDLDYPVAPYDSLSEQEQKKWDAEVSEILLKIEEIARRYLTSSQKSKQTIGNALLSSLYIPSHEYRFSINGSPVVAYWGFKDTQEEDKGGNSLTPTYSPVSLLQQPSLESKGAPSNSPRAYHIGATILWSSAALLFVIFLVLSILYPHRGIDKKFQDFATQSDSNDKDALMSELLYERSRENVLRMEIDRINNEINTLQCDCSSGESQYQDHSRQGQELTIPDQAMQNNDLSFLRGEWVSYTGLTSSLDNEPVTIEYTFDGEGKGGTTILRKHTRENCRGQARASIQDNELVIDTVSDVICNDSIKFVRSIVKCSLGVDGNAQCLGQADGDHFRVSIRRKRS